MIEIYESHNRLNTQFQPATLRLRQELEGSAAPCHQYNYCDALLVTSASGANGNGFGALLAFELDGRLLGTFIDDDRVADPRGFVVDLKVEA